MSEKPKKPPVDWERVEMLYRAGTVSVREIAAEVGISHTAINKRAKREEWDRDLKAKIKAKADAKVSRAEVSKRVSTETKVTEAVRIEIEAEVQSRIRLAHRADITRMRGLALMLLAECESEAGDPSVFEELGDLLRSEDENGQDRLNDAYRKAISLPQRIKGVKELAETLKTLIGLEREAYGLDADPSDQARSAGKNLSDAERASRLATILARAQAAMQAEAGGSSA